MLMKGLTNRKNRHYANLPFKTNTKESVYVVFYTEDKPRGFSHTCEGPFTDVEKAFKMRDEFLVQGICAWIVSYNG